MKLKWNAAIVSTVSILFISCSQGGGGGGSQAGPSGSGGVTPSPSGVTPSPSGVTPSPSGVTPAPSGVTPSPSGVTPAPSGVTAASYVPATRFGVYNNCQETAWVQKKYNTTTARPNEWLEKIEPGHYHDYNVTNAGLASFNIWAKFGCDSNGIHCRRGEVVDTNFVSGSDCDPTYGCQPDIETKFEATFGCSLSNTGDCAKDAKGLPLGASTFFDGSLVDGFTYKMSIHVITGVTGVTGVPENNPQCNNVSTPTFDFTNCPAHENLSSTSDRWLISNTGDEHWDWLKINTSWKDTMAASITTHMNETTWNTGILALRSLVAGYTGFYTGVTCADQIAPGDTKPEVTVDLTDQNLIVKDPNDNSIVGCASPANKLYGSRRWGTLGLVAQCTITGANFSEPTFDNLLLMYSNPYSDSDLVSASGNGHDNSNTPLFTQLLGFCSNYPQFCNPSGAPLSGLASIMGHAGPVSNTNYVSYIRQTAGQFYAWQYDDFNGTRVCSSTDTKIAVILCGD